MEDNNFESNKKDFIDAMQKLVNLAEVTIITMKDAKSDNDLIEAMREYNRVINQMTLELENE